MLGIIKQMMNTITDLTNDVLDYFQKKRKWKLKIYFLNQLVCTKKIEKFDDVSDIFKKPYICKVHKKHLFKTFNTQIILIPEKALFRDEAKRELHINCIIYEGVGISEL